MALDLRLVRRLFRVFCPRASSTIAETTAATRTCGIDAYTLAARRPIIAGEEVTNDYAASTGTTDFAMACTCGSSLCRGTVSGQDWQLPELQERYKDHRVPALLNRIRECW